MKKYLGKRIKRKKYEKYELEVGDSVILEIKMTSSDGEFEYFTEYKADEPSGKFEGIYQGTIRYILPGMPVFYIPKLDRYIAGFECWWWPKK